MATYPAPRRFAVTGTLGCNASMAGSEMVDRGEMSLTLAMSCSLVSLVSLG